MQPSLSKRESQVACLISEGLTLAKVAERLNIKYETVRTYRANISRKLDLRSKVEVTRYVLENPKLFKGVLDEITAE